MSQFAGRLKHLVLSGKLARTHMSRAAFKVLLVLAAHADRNGFVSLSQYAIAEQAGLARSSVQSAIADLLEADLAWLERRGSGRRPDTYCVVTERHIDAESLRIGRRSGPVHVSATESHGLAADLPTGRQDAVADLPTGQLVEESPRARTDTDFSALRCEELRDAGRSALRADRRASDEDFFSQSVDEIGSPPWPPFGRAIGGAPSARAEDGVETGSTLSEGNSHAVIGSADQPASRSSLNLATREQRRAIRDLSWRLEGEPERIVPRSQLARLSFDEASGLIAEHRSEVYYRENAPTGATFECRLSDLSSAEQERARRKGLEHMFIPEVKA